MRENQRNLKIKELNLTRGLAYKVRVSGIFFDYDKEWIHIFKCYEKIYNKEETVKLDGSEDWMDRI